MKGARTLKLVSALVVSGFVLVSGAQARSKFANLGTLTCTTSEAAPKAAVDAKLSCRFQSLTGQNGSFDGSIKRKGTADMPPGKRVLVWGVLALKPDLEPRALAGTYAGETGGQTAGRLRGGLNNNIILEPVTVTSQVGDNPVPSVLELRLDSVKI